jgi:hypothetical protein
MEKQCVRVEAIAFVKGTDILADPFFVDYTYAVSEKKAVCNVKFKHPRKDFRDVRTTIIIKNK